MKLCIALVLLVGNGIVTSWGFPLLQHNPVLRRETHDRGSLEHMMPNAHRFLMKRNDEMMGTASPSIWNPELRKFMAGTASLGAIETAYLTYTKVSGGSPTELLCSSTSDGASSCSSVLDGAYSIIPFTDNIPLASVGLAAYLGTLILAIGPLIYPTSAEGKQQDDTVNRIFLTAITTAMGTFSVFLMSILFGVLHTSCTYCIISAMLSIGLASASWVGGCIAFPSTLESSSTVPSSSGISSNTKSGLFVSAGSFVAALMASTVLFVSAGDGNAASNFAGNEGAAAAAAAVGDSSVTTLVASASVNAPPPITTTSSKQAIALSKNLRNLNARMYGAYWCSHCYDQKEAFGKEAFSNIEYVECSKDGLNEQNALCKEKKVPGYPTWEIKGKLFPGEQELDELEEIVQQFQ